MPPAIGDYLRPNDRILVGQALAEPQDLVRQLIEVSSDVPGMTAYCGYTLGSGWDAVRPGTLDVRGFIAHGGLRGLSRHGLLGIVPWHLSAMESNIESGLLPVDVVLLQVGPPDHDGNYNLGGTVDYVRAAVPSARAVLVEVNPQMPRTTSPYTLRAADVTAAFETDRPLITSPGRPATEAELSVSRNAAALVTDGGCLQIGLGPLADATVAALSTRKNLHVRAGVAGDWLVDLYESGAMAPGPATTAMSMAVGTRRLYDFINDNEAVRFGPTSELIDSTSLNGAGPLFAINSAVEVDLTGQVNAEVVAGQYVGGIGGQVDFMRAARRTRGGLAIIAMASTHPNGTSRIVAELSGPVTTARSDVDVVVTEHGVADLRAASVEERRRRLAAVAAPEHREGLLQPRADGP